MKLSWSVAISGVFIGYIAYSMYTFAQLFRNLECSDETTCFKSYLNSNPKLQLALFTSSSVNPISTEVKKLANIRNFDYREPYSRFVYDYKFAQIFLHCLYFHFRNFKVDVPLKTRR